MKYFDKFGNELNIGDSVNVPTKCDDIWEHEFCGVVIEFRFGDAVVEDGDGDCFSVECDRLEIESTI